MVDFKSLDMTSNVATVIKCPIDIVWPCMLDQATWMKDFKIQTVGGERNREGELKRVTPILEGYEEFFFRTLLLVPFRRFVYKAYTDHNGGRYAFTGIEMLSLADFGRDSAVTFEAYLEIQSAVMTNEELAEFVAVAKEGSLKLWEGNFRRLAAFVASESPC